VQLTGKAPLRVESRTADDDKVVRLSVVTQVPTLPEAFLEQLRSDDREAKAILFDRYAAHVRRILTRLLGNDPEVNDVLQDVFMAAYSGIHRLQDARALSGWVTQITVFTARNHIRRKNRQQLIGFLGFESLPDVSVNQVPEEIGDALRATYAVLSKMRTDHRIAFALRYIDGMELADVAAACGVSLATIKRRLNSAHATFIKLAQKLPALQEWIGGAV
jgi:RNA polymerase sigma-70 factor (ECF subfamily)